ncbi:bifunctional riboflavin kinase/FAD synthetase [Desmospora profundinema]|uniref:Riboflavin biosynthesis protein n=1 Tax=Desmospora profundinema TaxID=1571184 RepID=A0ABU1IHH6_9BACL|nr:bifunctional riboflavin kinase/FAD synthetase [Desmospora profundinema]MDR6224220.1 riboflavin kinase/FMN adenylyltransferase [Desmospora profundinema]
MKTIHLSHPHIPVPDAALSMAIGYFDGVHLGHQAVIQRAVQMGKSLNAQTAVMTFDPHPREVLGKGGVTDYLTPLSEKLEQFSCLGVDRVYVMRFDREFAAKTKEAFVRDVLLPLNVRGVAVGFNFNFGRGAEGKPDDLSRLGEGRIQVEVVGPVDRIGLPVSSTRLRQTLDEGRVEEAATILGRPYSLAGRVVEGDRIGRTIGYPTANLSLEEPYRIPATGVYVVEVLRGEATLAGMMNVGYRPTFTDSDPSLRLEVHLFDFSGDLYGEELKVAFLHRLRGEERFGSVEGLMDQLRTDEKNARVWLSRQRGESSFTS